MKKAILGILLAALIIIGAIYYYLIDPVLDIENKKMTYKGFTLVYPGNFNKQKWKSGLHYKKMYAKYWAWVRPLEGFSDDRMRRKYQNSYSFSDGKVFFYKGNKKIYIKSYVIKDESVLLIQLTVNSTLSEWVEEYMKWLEPAADGLSKGEASELANRIKTGRKLVDRELLFFILAGSMLLLAVILWLAFSLSSKSPKDMRLYETEGIIFSKGGVPAAAKGKMNYNISYYYILMTNSYFRMFHFGKVLIKIPREEIGNHIKNGNSLEFSKGQYTFVVKLKSIEGIPI